MSEKDLVYFEWVHGLYNAEREELIYVVISCRYKSLQYVNKLGVLLLAHTGGKPSYSILASILVSNFWLFQLKYSVHVIP